MKGAIEEEYGRISLEREFKKKKKKKKKKKGNGKKKKKVFGKK